MSKTMNKISNNNKIQSVGNLKIFRYQRKLNQ